MRRIASPLLVLIACSLAVQAADQTASRAVRQEEGRQKGLTSQTSATGREVSGLIDEYRFNGIGDETKLKVLDKLQGELVRLTDATTAPTIVPGADTTTMPWVTTRLNAARQLQNLVELRKELLAASAGQDHIVVQLDKLLKQLQEQFGKQLKTDLTQVIQEQQRLKDTTEQLADKSLGKKAEELTKEQKTDLEKTSEQQQALENQVKEAVQELKKQAEEAKTSDPEQAKNAEKALEKITDPKVQDAIEKAAQDIAQNQLAQAQDAQQQVLDALKQAQQELAKSDSQQAQQPQDQSAAQLEQQLAAVENISQQQQALLDQTKALDAQSSPQDFNKLQAQEASLQNQLAQLQPQGDAAKAAEKAEAAMKDAGKELGEQDKGDAAAAEQKALDALGELKAELAAELAAATGAPMPGAPKPPMPGEGPDSPMPPQLVVQSQSQVKDPKDPKELGADLENGAKREAPAPAAWQVALPAKEREALTAAQKDRFPTRYERQLALYYQNLASGGK